MAVVTVCVDASISPPGKCKIIVVSESSEGDDVEGYVGSVDDVMQHDGVCARRGHERDRDRTASKGGVATSTFDDGAGSLDVVEEE